MPPFFYYIVPVKQTENIPGEILNSPDIKIKPLKIKYKFNNEERGFCAVKVSQQIDDIGISEISEGVFNGFSNP